MIALGTYTSVSDDARELFQALSESIQKLKRHLIGFIGGLRLKVYSTGCNHFICTRQDVTNSYSSFWFWE